MIIPEERYIFPSYVFSDGKKINAYIDFYSHRNIEGYFYLQNLQPYHYANIKYYIDILKNHPLSDKGNFLLERFEELYQK